MGSLTKVRVLSSSESSKCDQTCEVLTGKSIMFLIEHNSETKTVNRPIVFSVGSCVVIQVLRKLRANMKKNQNCNMISAIEQESFSILLVRATGVQVCQSPGLCENPTTIPGKCKIHQYMFVAVIQKLRALPTCLSALSGTRVRTFRSALDMSCRRLPVAYCTNASRYSGTCTCRQLGT